jgi:hypothetical protein
MIYIITPTGGREEGLRLLAGYLNAQTYAGPITWVVVDDCDPVTEIPPMRPGIAVVSVVPDWTWKPGDNTQSRCMAEALAHCQDDAVVVVMEDDDAYLPGHIENVVGALGSANLVGERVSTYYNVATRRWRLLPGRYHASLCSVACKGSALAMLREICAVGSRTIDMDLWKRYRGPSKLLETRNVVGIKGLPGRAGIGVGHRQTFGDPDPEGAVLKKLLGPMADQYLG